MTTSLTNTAEPVTPSIVTAGDERVEELRFLVKTGQPLLSRLVTFIV